MQQTCENVSYHANLDIYRKRSCSVCKYILAFSADWIDFMLLFSYICVTMTKIQFFKSAVNRLPAAAYFHVHVNICQNRV